MGRLRAETLERLEEYADRVLDVADEIEKLKKSQRIIDQVSASGTSAGASIFEADEAQSAKDFAKSLGVVLKELNETYFWLRVFVRRGWIKAERLDPLLNETKELKSMFGAMVIRTRRTAAAAAKRPSSR